MTNKTNNMREAYEEQGVKYPDSQLEETSAELNEARNKALETIKMLDESIARIDKLLK